jgi:hypothetical protein
MKGALPPCPHTHIYGVGDYDFDTVSFRRTAASIFTVVLRQRVPSNFQTSEDFQSSVTAV